MFNIEVPGFLWGTVKTRNSFNYQIKLCSDLASKWKSEMPNLKLINATEGGAFIDGFEHITLKNFHKSYCLKKPLSQKNIVIRNPNWDRGAQLSEYFKFLEKTFDAINIIASEFKNSIKKLRLAGINKRINRAIQKFQNPTNRLLLQISMQDEITQTVGTHKRKTETYSTFFKRLSKRRNFSKKKFRC